MVADAHDLAGVSCPRTIRHVPPGPGAGQAVPLWCISAPSAPGAPGAPGVADVADVTLLRSGALRVAASK